MNPFVFRYFVLHKSSCGPVSAIALSTISTTVRAVAAEMGTHVLAGLP